MLRVPVGKVGVGKVGVGKVGVRQIDWGAREMLPA
jgi:hypothetical protein